MASYPRGKSEVRPIEIGGFALTETGAAPQSSKVRPTKQGWLAAAAFVKHVEVAAPYWVGDLLLWLEKSSGWDDQTIDQLTGQTGWARQTVYNHKHIASRLDTEAREVAPSFSHARAVAALEPKQQLKVLKRAREEELTASQTAKVAQKIMRPRVVEGQAKLEGKYRVIYADPPWKYDNDRAMPDGSLTSAHDSYDGLTIEEICALPIVDHALDNAVLFMWATNSHLLQNPGAREVIEAWGFEYRTNYAWDKVLGRPGHYSYSQHELLLVAVRGSCTPDVPILQHDHASIFTERRRGEHSQKPLHARKMITSLYTDGPYLELFGREKVRGWTVFGNDARLWSKGA
jgi:N6-adenosine-specific RNA methylase IME4